MRVLVGNPFFEGDENTPSGVFPITVRDVPDADFYKVEVSHRGAITVSRADMVANGWRVAASLGYSSGPFVTM